MGVTSKVYTHTHTCKVANACTHTYVHTHTYPHTHTHTVIDCGQLPPPRNGRVILSGTDFGSEAVYGCQDGFNLVGFELRTCQADGTWSGEAPRCVREDGERRERGSSCLFIQKIVLEEAIIVLWKGKLV